MQSELDQLLTLQRDDLTAVIELLSAERNALKQRDIDALGQVAQQKSTLLSQIQARDSEITALFQQQQHDQPHELEQEIKTLLAECKQLNEINGQAIELSLLSLSRLHAAMAQAQGQGSVTYDNKGQTQATISTGRSIEA